MMCCDFTVRINIVPLFHNGANNLPMPDGQRNIPVMFIIGLVKLIN